MAEFSTPRPLSGTGPGARGEQLLRLSCAVSVPGQFKKAPLRSSRSQIVAASCSMWAVLVFSALLGPALGSENFVG